MTAASANNIMLSDILNGICDVPASQDKVITGVSEHSADVETGDMFVAQTTLSYCQQAINNGASAIICQSDLLLKRQAEEMSLKYKVPVIVCNNLSAQVEKIIQRFYQDDTKAINTVAITGTDGKSSVAYLVAQALESLGDPCGLVGTLGIGSLNQLLEATHTTPPRARIAKEYRRFKQSGYSFVALEASSHGISQGRLNALNIHTAVLTNITRDHLDYHKTIEAYIQAKAALFFEHDAKFAVINLDDEIGSQWCNSLSNKLNVVSYSLSNSKAAIYASNIEYKSSSTCLNIRIKGVEIKVCTTLLGEFNVLNLLAVAAVLCSLNKSNSEISIALNKLDAVPGRMQQVQSASHKNIVVDYAHTPAALHAAINAMRKHYQGKLICVFGCGGDRDKGKRVQMGEVASTYCDYAVITSDNPRHESPQEIINQITQGCLAGSQYKTIIDRKDAIRHALQVHSDAVLIAGKGHEKYQHIGDQRIAFDDIEVVNAELQRMADG